MVVVLACTQTARAYWQVPGAGAGTASTATLGAPVASVSGTAWSSTVHVAWTPALTSGGVAATSYVVRRVDTADGSTTAACGTSAASPTTALACDDTGVPTGTHRYVVTAALGSWTSVSAASATFSTDVSSPSVTVTSVSPAAAASGYHLSGPVTVGLTASDSGPAGVQSISYRIDSLALVTVAGTTASAVVIGEGVHTVSYHATDAAGNVSSTGTHVFTIDSTAPTVAVTRAAGQASPTKDAPIVFTVTFSEPVTGFSAADVVLSGGIGGSASVSGTGPGYTVSVNGLTADGTLAASVVAGAATDVAGNASLVSTSDSVVRDTTAPTVAVTSYTNNFGTLTLTGTTGPAATVATDATTLSVTFCPGVAVFGIGLIAPDFSSCAATSVTTSNGSWTTTTTVSVLVAGSYFARIVPTDAAGNVGTAVVRSPP